MINDLAREIGKKNRRELERHWQEMVWDGHGAWAGDRFINLKENILTLEIEAWYELPNQEPVLVLKVPRDEFDIDKLCRSLHRADNRNVSVKQKIIEVDANNAAIEMARAKQISDLNEEGAARLQHAIVRDVDPGAPRLHVIERNIR